jgi:hypothetical protein
MRKNIAANQKGRRNFRKKTRVKMHKRRKKKEWARLTSPMALCKYVVSA